MSITIKAKNTVQIRHIKNSINTIIEQSQQPMASINANFKRLEKLIRRNPQYGSLILKKMSVLTNLNRFMLFFNNSYHLITIKFLIPSAAESIIRLLITNINIYSTIISNNEDLYYTETTFSRYRDTLIKIAFSNSGNYDKYISDAFSLRQAARMFPHYLNLIIQTMSFSKIKSHPFYSHVDDFCVTIKSLPLYQLELATLLFNNINQFDFIFKNKTDLTHAFAVLRTTKFKSLVDKDTINEARESVKNRLTIMSKSEIEKNVSTLVILARYNSNSIHLLQSLDLICNIAAYTGDYQVHSFTEGQKISYEHNSNTFHPPGKSV